MQGRMLLAAALMVLPACSEAPGGFTLPSGLEPQALIVGPEVWFTRVAAGSGFTCAARSDGAVECWGDPNFGTPPSLRTPGGGAFIQIESRTGRTCALRSDGVAECWGLGTDLIGPEVWAPMSGSFIDVATNAFIDCAVRDDGAMECREGTPTGPELTVREAIGASYVDATLGYQECAVKSDRSAECWSGPFIRDQLLLASSLGFTQLVEAPQFRCWLTGSLVQCHPGLGDPPGGVLERTASSGGFTAFDTWRNHACGLRNDGAIECWGDNTHGAAPAFVTAAAGSFTQVSTGDNHTCALRTDGAVECWGSNSTGQAPAVRLATRERVLPTAIFTAPASVIVTSPFVLALTDAQVPGHPSATTFTFAFDCGDGSGYAAAGSAASASCPTTAVGARTVKGMVIDQDGDSREYRATVTVKSAQEGTADLRATITTASLAPDIRKALLAKLDAALKAIEQGRKAAACSALADFINQVRAQSGKAIDATTADAWILAAQELQAALGC